MDRNDTDRDDAVNTIKGDMRDAIDEAKHRVAAGGEKMKRAVEGDRMPLGDRIVSHVKEAGHDIAADADRASRDVRHEDDV
ncbi:hypothetical protein WPS_33720 [Vulcanimicrobium alpinum]|uniref:Uncharacterized protein n=1 Tax=Vulcanimicrobium alpinum TaxID=3016050 RepID=A0AAN2CBC8_UNVUL|nr:hypothetical protein [Vulcanimicrobium alpinum]BDE08096.1 hypothetical protein WPS_33720 [Vulcanimicrobium alpinum]